MSAEKWLYNMYGGQLQPVQVCMLSSNFQCQSACCLRSVYNEKEGRLHPVLGTEQTQVHKMHRSLDLMSQARKAEGGVGGRVGAAEYTWGGGRPTYLDRQFSGIQASATNLGG